MSEDLSETPREEITAEPVETVEAAEIQAPEVADAHTMQNEKEETPVLDVHPAHHAASSWKEFLVHIATIVLGLLIAVGLEQFVEYIHHRYEVRDTREMLRDEREKNRRMVALLTASFRYQAVEYQNNFLVLTYLKQHPGTPEDKLPGLMLWATVDSAFVESAWKTSLQSGITSLMPRKEAVEDERLYGALDYIASAEEVLWSNFTDATRYRLTDPDIGHLSPADVALELDRVQTMIGDNYKLGLALKAMHLRYPDFDTPSQEEVFAMRYRRSDADNAKLVAAKSLSDARVAKADAAFEEALKKAKAEQ